MGGMLGYGPFHYRYASGREGDACKLWIASNASYISLYCFAADANGYVAERYVDKLPKGSIGRRACGSRSRGRRREDARCAHQRDREGWASSPEPARVGAAVRPRAGGEVARLHPTEALRQVVGSPKTNPRQLLVGHRGPDARTGTVTCTLDGSGGET